MVSETTERTVDVVVPCIVEGIATAVAVAEFSYRSFELEPLEWEPVSYTHLARLIGVKCFCKEQRSYRDAFSFGLGHGLCAVSYTHLNISIGGHGLTNRDLLKECYYFVGIHFALPK